MNFKRCLILCFFFLFFTFLFAENYMELIWQQEGEFIESEYGFSLASLDYNGDGIDDLIVGSPEWNSSGSPGGNNQGKIYFYFGGTVLDTIPDLTLDGSQNQFHSRYGDHIVNIHDVNGDSFEDLAIIHYDHWESDTLAFIDVYYGGPNYDLIPDFSHTIYSNNVEDITSLYPIGDINGDGYCDVGFITYSTVPICANSFFIIYGGQNPSVELWAEFGNGGCTIREIGNINDDEYDDFIISYHDNAYDCTYNIIFFGDSEVEPVIEDTLYYNTANFIPGGSFAGDFNGDGIDDFIGCWSGFGGTGLWFGSNILSLEPNIILLIYSNGNKSIGVGDLNNDGISDIVLGNPYWSNDQGKAYFFIGDVHANGSIDLDIPAPIIVGSKFGTSIAIGDFNGDGFADAAVGAPSPYSSWYPGYVYVYAGNDSLAETTPVDIHEEEIPTTGNIEFNAYPNPFNPIVTFEIIAEDYKNLQIEIFNVKGQKIETISPSLCHPELIEGRGEIITWDAEEHSSGIHLCRLVNIETKKQLAVQKVTLLK